MYISKNGKNTWVRKTKTIVLEIKSSHHHHHHHPGEKDQTKESTLGALSPNNNFKSFCRGVKFKSKQITLLLFDLFRIGTFTTTWFIEENPSFRATRCLFMCPPSAWPRENSWPQMEHSCFLGLFPFSSSFTSCLGVLWLALWPPRAWNEENLRLQVLHSNSTGPKSFWGLISLGWESSIKQFAKSTLSSLTLFIATTHVELVWNNET